jgi:hypothetical protein
MSEPDTTIEATPEKRFACTAGVCRDPAWCSQHELCKHWASPKDDIDPQLALVLLWHYSETSSPAVPKWASQHPLWPDPGDFNRAMMARGVLQRAALPLIEELEREVGHGE